MEDGSNPNTRANKVEVVLDNVYEEIKLGKTKSSIADFIRLIQVSGELKPESFGGLRVEWVETIGMESVDA